METALRERWAKDVGYPHGVVWDAPDRRWEEDSKAVCAVVVRGPTADSVASSRLLPIFLRRQLEILVFDANRLEGTLPEGAVEGPTMERIRGFLQGSPGSEPSAVPWDAEGGHGTLASSDRQLWQFSRAAEHLLVHRTHSPLSAQIILDTHRLAMEGSIDGTSHQPVVVGRFRGPGEEVHADSYKYLPGAEVESAVAKLVDLYETRRNLLHPIELATWLFYELVTIHPFGNGNGRVCRLFLSWSLMRDGFPFPIAFSSGHSKARKHYVRAIFRARRLSGDRGDLNAMLLVSMDGALSNFVDHVRLLA